MLVEALRCRLGHYRAYFLFTVLLDGGAALDLATVAIWRARHPTIVELLDICTLLSVTRSAQIGLARFHDRAAWAKETPVILLVVRRCHHCPINASSVVKPGPIDRRCHC